MHLKYVYFAYDDTWKHAPTANIANGINRPIRPMPLNTTIGRFEIVLPLWNLSSLLMLPSQDIPSFSTTSTTLRRKFECHKKDCLDCDAMLLLQDLTRPMTSPIVVTTLSKPLVAPTIIMSTLHGKLFILFFTVHVTKSRISILHCASNALTLKHSNLTANEIPISDIHPVPLWIAVEQRAKSRYLPFTIIPHTLFDEYARVSSSISCLPSTLWNTTTYSCSIQGSSSPCQVPSALALALLVQVQCCYC